MTKVQYQLEFSDITAHRISVTLRFKPAQHVHVLQLPAWIPGSYMIRDFARNIIAINAFDSAGSLSLQQLDKQCWRLACSDREVTVNYQIYAYDLSVRAAYVDDEIAIVNPACVCLSVDGFEQHRHELNIVKPNNSVAKEWRLATGLRADSDTEWLGFGRYSADNYQQLIDTPFLAGHFVISEFQQQQIPHYVVITGKQLTDQQRLTDDVARICQQQAEVFGRLPDDLQQYWFLLWVTEDGYGGLEHHNSTLLLCNRTDLPIAGESKISDSYQNLLGLFSHEYFHTWWVKRLKPATYHQYQLSKEHYTSQLWLYEGFTSYFDDLALVKAELISRDDYVKTVEKLISKVTRNPSDRKQSLADSSFNAWTKFYKQDENAVNNVVSYYAKGALLALCLDAALTRSGFNLTWLVRQLWQQYLVTGTPDDAVQAILRQHGLVSQAQSVTSWIHASTPLPLAQELPALGMQLVFRSAQHNDDLSGASIQSRTPPSLGAQYKSSNGVIQLSQVYIDGAAHQAGLMVGDQLLAIAGYKVTATNITDLLQRFGENSTETIHLYRKDRLLVLQLPMIKAAEHTAMLLPVDDVKVTSWLNART